MLDIKHPPRGLALQADFPLRGGASSKRRIRMLPVHLISPQLNEERAINVGEELESLITTVGGEIPDRILQKLDHPNPATYIGKGKVREVAQKITEENIDVVVLNAMVKPRQAYALKTQLQKTSP